MMELKVVGDIPLFEAPSLVLFLLLDIFETVNLLIVLQSRFTPKIDSIYI